MATLDFAIPVKEDEDDPRVVCERRLRPLIDEVVQAAMKEGWDKKDVLLSLMELSWSMYEDGRDGAS